MECLLKLHYNNSHSPVRKNTITTADQGGLRTAFDQSDAQYQFLKLSSLVVSESLYKITPGGANSTACVIKKEYSYFIIVLFSIMRVFFGLKGASCRVTIQTLSQN